MDAERFIRDFVDASWNSLDEAAVRSMCDGDVAERLLGWAERVRLGGEDLTVRVDLVTTNPAGWVGTLQTREQTHTGPMTGPFVDDLTAGGEIPPSGTRSVSQSAVFYRIAHGRITEVVNVSDNLRFFSQFGRMRLELDQQPQTSQ